MLPKVFYNDECSVCNIEIDHYKKNVQLLNGLGSIKLLILKNTLIKLQKK